MSRQNRRIAALQRDGTFWTHSHEAFLDAVRGAGFEVLHATTTFRGISDLVEVVKPAA